MKSILAVVLLSLLLLIIGIKSEPAGDSIYGRSVLVDLQRVDWAAALRVCHAKGMTLLTIDSEGKEQKVVQFGKKYGVNSVWIGAYYCPRTGAWIWSESGQEVEHMPWKGSDELKSRFKGHCVAVSLEEYPAIWSGSNCNEELPFICENLPENDEEFEEQEEEKNWWEYYQDYERTYEDSSEEIEFNEPSKSERSTTASLFFCLAWILYLTILT